MKKFLYGIVLLLIAINLTSCLSMFTTVATEEALAETFENVIIDPYYKAEITELCMTNGISVYYNEADRITTFQKGNLGFDLTHTGEVRYFLETTLSNEDQGNYYTKELEYRCYGTSLTVSLPKDCIKSTSEYKSRSYNGGTKYYTLYTDTIGITFAANGDVATFLENNWKEGKSLYIDFNGSKNVTKEYPAEKYRSIIDLKMLIDKEFNKTEEDLRWENF